MRTLLKTGCAALLLCGLALSARCEEAPDRLTIGYENEGKIDASPQACVALVKEITEWNKADTDKGARDVCAARKRHIEAYRALQGAYKSFLAAMAKDRRLSAKDAASSFGAMMKACIDHKSNLTTGGHNIMIDVIENDTITACLTLGANVLRDEARSLTVKYQQ